MLYYILPSVFSVSSNIQCIFHKETETLQNPVISFTLAHYLYEIKNNIQKYETEWEQYKKYTNPFEYINTTIPFQNKCISKYKPLSRSYFKMIEIIHIFFNELMHGTDDFSTYINTFHLAEGPGGFIEAIVNSRQNKMDTCIGISLQPTNTTIPGWKKSFQFLKNNPNVIIENGFDNTGNILSLDNFLYCRSKYKNSMNFITADGGFDFTTDFNSQENNVVRLLFAQIAFALCLQKKGGSFVLKIFDIFFESTIDLLYILSSFYEKVYITKPLTSRFANSEKYVVCKNFLYENDNSFFSYLYNTFEQMMFFPQLSIKRFLTLPIPIYFLNKLEEYNAIFGQQQIENIYNTICLIQNEQKNKNNKNIKWNRISIETECHGVGGNDLRILDIQRCNEKTVVIQKIDSLIKNNIQKCIMWCVKHNIQYNS